MSSLVIECREVCKKFTRGERRDSLRDAVPALFRWLSGRRRGELNQRQFWALDQVSFQVRQGEVLGIIGPNGAGKSTLLKLLSSILVPDRGEIGIRGRLTALIEVGAGFHPDLTGRENIFLNGAILGMTRREINRKLGEIVEFSGVGEFIDTPVKRYSSGMQARLGFSVAAHMDPDILLVDEVLAVGDAQFQQRCLDKMHYFSDSGRSIVFISHNLQAVSELCPQSMLLMRGQKKFLGETSQAIRLYLDSMREKSHSLPQDGVALQNILLLDEHDRECDHFEAGDRARLTFDLNLDQPAAQYFLGFAIQRVTDGLMTADYNLELPLSVKSVDKNSLALDFDINFLSGSYSITLFLKHRASYRNVVFLDFVKLFNVSEASAYAGVTHVAPRLSLDQERVTGKTAFKIAR